MCLVYKHSYDIVSQIVNRKMTKDTRIKMSQVIEVLENWKTDTIQNDSFTQPVAQTQLDAPQG